MPYPKVVQAWCATQTRCAVCWCDLAQCWPPAAVHHLVRRGRQNLLCNLLALCSGCHEDHHGQNRPGFPGLTFSHLLTAKLESDPANWEPEKLEEIYGRRLPFLMPIPSEYLQERGYVG